MDGFVLEDRFERDAEGAGDLESQRQRWGVFALFNGDNGLARHTNDVSQMLLGHFAFFKSQPANLITEMGATHRPAPARIGTESPQN